MGDTQWPTHDFRMKGGRLKLIIGFCRQTQDFNLSFGTGPKIFIWVLEMTQDFHTIFECGEDAATDP